jgi:hypothetical protein
VAADPRLVANFLHSGLEAGADPWAGYGVPSGLTIDQASTLKTAACKARSDILFKIISFLF